MLTRLLLACALAVLSSVVPAQTLLRACPTQPSTNGWAACPNSVWAAPAAALVVDIQRSGVTGDVWLTPNQLVAGDRVFACTDPSIAPGPFKSCPTTLAGQTNNYLDASKVSFGAAPVPATGQIDWSWLTPTLNADGSPLTDLAGYHLYTRAQTVAVYPAPAILPATATDALLKNLSGNQCAQIAAFNLAGTVGEMSDEVCAAPSIKASAPAKILLTVKAP